MYVDATTLRHRYPGAGPFQDDDVSKKTFFGREEEAHDLASRVEVCRLTIVYGRSGLGKSSLLQAGLTTSLRKSGYFPVFVRVNHVEVSLIIAIADYIEAEAQRQGIEYVRGDTGSPWEYFKSLELWDDDRLLVPVIILDQFEEVFSTGSEEQQDAIIKQVGLMARGTPSSENEKDLVLLEEKYGSSSPKLQIVVALREDYLGHLEEVADEIPGIFDSRFRVTPLNLEAAREALVLPATVDSDVFQSPVFDIDEGLVSHALDYLASGTNARLRRKRSGIEPFQLQLIGRRIEETAQRLKVKTGVERPLVSFADVGGEAGLTRALGDFYVTALAEIKSWRDRRKVKSLCLNFLISPDGKRQSIDEEGITRLTGLEPGILKDLTESRLLRIDTRADTKYYELSHDTLVEPILASQGISAKSIRLIYFFLLCSGLISLVSLTVLAVMELFKPLGDANEDKITMAFVIAFCSFGALWLFRLAKRSYRNYTRLNRLQKQSDRVRSFRSKLYQKMIAIAQIGIGLPLVTVCLVLAAESITEMPGSKQFFLDRFAFAIGFISMAIYGVSLIIRGFRNMFDMMAYKRKLIKSKSVCFSSVTHHLRWLLLVVLLVALLAIIVPLATLSDCSGRYFTQFSNVVSTLYLSDLAAWCEEEHYSTMEDFVYEILAGSVAAFGLLRIYSFVRRVSAHGI